MNICYWWWVLFCFVAVDSLCRVFMLDTHLIPPSRNTLMDVINQIYIKSKYVLIRHHLSRVNINDLTDFFSLVSCFCSTWMWNMWQKCVGKNTFFLLSLALALALVINICFPFFHYINSFELPSVDFLTWFACFYFTCNYVLFVLTLFFFALISLLSYNSFASKWFSVYFNFIYEQIKSSNICTR